MPSALVAGHGRLLRAEIQRRSNIGHNATAPGKTRRRTVKGADCAALSIADIPTLTNARANALPAIA